MIRKANNATTKPIIAATIVPLADSTFDLSPPDMIHFIPPISRNITAIITARIRIIVIAFGIAPSKVVRFSPHKELNSVPSGQRFTAKAGFAAKGKIENAVINAKILLTNFSIVSLYLFVKGEVVCYGIEKVKLAGWCYL